MTQMRPFHFGFDAQMGFYENDNILENHRISTFKLIVDIPVQAEHHCLGLTTIELILDIRVIAKHVIHTMFTVSILILLSTRITIPNHMLILPYYSAENIVYKNINMQANNC